MREKGTAFNSMLKNCVSVEDSPHNRAYVHHQEAPAPAGSQSQHFANGSIPHTSAKR